MGRRLRPLMLSEADQHAMLIQMRCHGCGVIRNYYPRDLMELCGDGSADDMERKFRCVKCGETRYMTAKWKSTQGVAPGEMTVRRLVRVRYVRVPEWVDEVV